MRGILRDPNLGGYAAKVMSTNNTNKHERIETAAAWRRLFVRFVLFVDKKPSSRRARRCGENSSSGASRHSLTGGGRHTGPLSTARVTA
jgi:hypothetical protein